MISGSAYGGSDMGGRYGHESQTSHSVAKAKRKLGGPMNIEEIRMNKDLLKEISILKKQGNLAGVTRSRGSIGGHQDLGASPVTDYGGTPLD